MKKLFNVISTLLLLAILVFQAQAQQLELEKTYKISRASKRGFLAGLDYDREAKRYTLTYFTDQKKNMFKYEQYVFDQDFNFIEDRELEEEAEKMKKKFRWFRFKGETVITMGNTVENNLMGTLVLKKKKITSKYSFLKGGYTKDVDILDKVKPKTEDGNSYTRMAHAEDDMNGDLYVLATVKGKMGSKGNDDAGSVRLLKFNSDLELVKTADLEFPYTQSLAFVRAVDKENFDDPDNPGVAGLVFVFAPSNIMGKKKADPNNNNYTYIKVDDQCNVTEKFSFTSPASYWHIDEMIYNDKGETYFYGPSAAGKDKYYNEGTKPMFGNQNAEVKFKAVQLMKVTNGKMNYITETSLDEIKSKQKFPPNQRKTPDYEGREFGIRNYMFASNGDFLVIGQNYDKNKAGQINKFEDVLGFQFDSEGRLRAQYGLDTKEKGIAIDYSTSHFLNYTTVTKTTSIYACPQTIIEGSDKNLYWVLQEIKGNGNGKLLTYPRIGRINTNDATLSELKTFGKGDGFYLHPDYPLLETDKGETLVFFGADKPGRELWFARVKLK